MKHEPNCLIYICTCGLKKDLKKLESGLSEMRNQLRVLETLLEAHDRIWPDPKHITPSDVSFIREVNKRK